MTPLVFGHDLARVVQRDGMLGQMRLAWWRDALGKPVGERPRGDAVLDGIGLHWQGREASLVAMVDAWEVLVTAQAIGGDEAAAFGTGRGAFFAARQGIVSPESFTFIESALILAIVVLGGMGSQIGVVLAAIVMTILPELTREFNEYRMLLFGLAMVLIMVWRPGGLLSHREPTVRLNALGKTTATKEAAR